MVNKGLERNRARNERFGIFMPKAFRDNREERRRLLKGLNLICEKIIPTVSLNSFSDAKRNSGHL